MRSIKSKFTYLALASMAFLSFSACESNEKQSEESVSNSSVGEEELNRNRGQIDNALVQNKNWQAHWSSSVGSFDASEFNLMMTDSIDPMEMPEKNPVSTLDPLYPYQFENPGGNGRMDIYSYKIEAHESVEAPFLNPDAEVVWYKQDGMKERLLFMGPSGMFEDGMWLNEEEFIVFGFFQGVSGYRPMAWLINVETHILKQFQLDKTSDSYAPESYINAKIKQLELD